MLELELRPVHCQEIAGRRGRRSVRSKHGQKSLDCCPMLPELGCARPLLLCCGGCDCAGSGAHLRLPAAPGPCRRVDSASGLSWWASSQAT